MQKFKETGDSRYIYQNELDKACFQHDMAYGDFKDLNSRTTCDPKCDGYQRGLLSMFYNFLIKYPLCLQLNLLPMEQIKMRIFQIKNLLKNYTKQ